MQIRMSGRATMGVTLLGLAATMQGAEKRLVPVQQPAGLISVEGLSLHAISNRAAAGFQPMSLEDGTQVYVAAKPMLDNSQIINANEASTKSETTLTLRATREGAQKIATIQGRGVAVLRYGELVDVVPMSVSGDDVRLIFPSVPRALHANFRNGQGSILPPDSPTITAIARETSVQPGGTVTIDVFVSGAESLRAFQVSLTPAADVADQLELQRLFVDADRPDYVFHREQAVFAEDQKTGRITGALYSGSVRIVESAYLGTFIFQAAKDANGPVEVQIRADHRTLLRGAGGKPIAFTVGAPVQVTAGTAVRPLQRR